MRNFFLKQANLVINGTEVNIFPDLSPITLKKQHELNFVTAF